MPKYECIGMIISGTYNRIESFLPTSLVRSLFHNPDIYSIVPFVPLLYSSNHSRSSIVSTLPLHLLGIWVGPMLHEKRAEWVLMIWWVDNLQPSNWFMNGNSEKYWNCEQYQHLVIPLTCGHFPEAVSIQKPAEVILTVHTPTIPTPCGSYVYKWQ
jgi:hypothetical protein